MLGDDSFNDSDEMFNLYSAKKVTETFRAQFRKLVSNHVCLTNENKVKNTEVHDKHENKNTVKVKEKFYTDNLLDMNKCNKSPEILEVDDSLEIVEEIVPRKTRRSERLRQKKDNTSSHVIGNLGSNADVPLTKGRKKKPGRKKKQDNKSKSVVDEVTLDDSSHSADNLEEDEVNPEVSVKVIWKSTNLKKFTIRKFQKISKIFEELSKEENIPEDKIMLTFNNIKVNRNDTPDSLNLKVFHFLDGGVLSELTNNNETLNLPTQHNNSDSVTIKFQDVNKKIVSVTLNKNDKMKVGMIKYSEQLEIPLEKIKFFFDGELINASQTPVSLGLENDEIIDIKINY